MGRKALVYIGSWKELSQESGIFSVFDCHQVLTQSFCSLQSTSGVLPQWMSMMIPLSGSCCRLQITKIKFQEVSQHFNVLALTPTPSLNLEEYEVYEPGTEIPPEQDRKFLPWPDSQPTQLGSVWFCAQLTAFGLESFRTQPWAPWKESGEGCWGGLLWASLLFIQQTFAGQLLWAQQ